MDNSVPEAQNIQWGHMKNATLSHFFIVAELLLDPHILLLSILMAISPGEPGLAGFDGAMVWFGLVWLGFNGTFSTNRLYCAITVG